MALYMDVPQADRLGAVLKTSFVRSQLFVVCLVTVCLKDVNVEASSGSQTPNRRPLCPRFGMRVPETVL